jgi:hypothetical protein
MTKASSEISDPKPSAKKALTMNRVPNSVMFWGKSTRKIAQ